MPRYHVKIRKYIEQVFEVTAENEENAKLFEGDDVQLFSEEIIDDPVDFVSVTKLGPDDLESEDEE